MVRCVSEKFTTTREAVLRVMTEPSASGVTLTSPSRVL
jgi:hypothetical protein